jgi:hypothetical protein
MFSACSVQSGYKEDFWRKVERGEWSFETPACQDMSLEAEDLNCVI